MSLPEAGSINFLAVGVSAVAVFMLGGVWYTALFGKKWADLHGIGAEAQAAAAKRMPGVFALLFAAYVVMAMGVAVIAPMTGATTALQGAGLGALLWIGVGAPVAFTNMLPTGKPLGIFLIDTGYQLLSLVMTGAVVAAWR